MRYRALIPACVALLALPAFGPRALQAAVDSWYFGGAFSIGGVRLRVGYVDYGRWGPSYYFEAAKPFRYRGYRCSDRCYVRGRSHLHHPSCNATAYHFRRHGYSSRYLIDRFGPVLPRHRYYGPPARYYGAPPSYDRFRYPPPRYRNHRRYDYRHDDRRHRDHHKRRPPRHRGGFHGYDGDDSDSDSY